jgi:hypothetical protein
LRLLLCVPHGFFNLNNDSKSSIYAAKLKSRKGIKVNNLLQYSIGSDCSCIKFVVFYLRKGVSMKNKRLYSKFNELNNN